MKNSSAARLDYQDSRTSADSSKGSSSAAVGETLSPPTVSEPLDRSASTGSLRAPDFGDLGSIYAITAKLAGRLNASKISDEEHDGFLRERQMLLDKTFEGNITRKELNRLEYVRWTLDRIEDARHGEALDILGMAVSRYEQFGEGLLKLQQDLADAVEAERERQRRRSKGNPRR